MGIEIYLIAVILLLSFAFIYLIVGVSNDAVNFLNSSIGSGVASRNMIMITASIGIMFGVIFSSGMMEVARKSIFHPQLFTMPEIMIIFLVVMLSNVVLLDVFNTYGLPTSTTVALVFALLGGAVSVSIMKIILQNENLVELTKYINTGKALIIIFGILLSIIIAFTAGAIAQFISRLIFTFEFKKQIKRYGAIWGGIALTMITYFIIVKGAKSAFFISDSQATWIRTHTQLILLQIFIVATILLQILMFFKINILKPIVMIGTLALAMAFAANDLVNFIGVPIAGYHAYNFAVESNSPLTTTMEALGDKVPAVTYLLVLSGLIMVITLWFSKKARTVTETEISLGHQGEGEEKFESMPFSRTIVRMFITLFEFSRTVIPSQFQQWIARRLDTTKFIPDTENEQYQAFDLLRASVNLMVASAVISYATSYKLPLSTTYVTFMVAMGTSFSDLAWGRESAVYRVTGVLTVIGGWFMTALIAFILAGLMAILLFYSFIFGIITLLALVALVIWSNHHRHKERFKHSEMDKVFNLKKVTQIDETVLITFQQLGLLVKEIRSSLDITLDALFNLNENRLKGERRKTKRIQRWANIITANIFKTIRLMEIEHLNVSTNYGQTIRRLQKLVDGHRDIVLRAHVHVGNHHKGLLPVQVKELQEAQKIMDGLFSDLENALATRDMSIYDKMKSKYKKIKDISHKQNDEQIDRIRSGESKTRLSILSYAIMGNAMMLSKQCLRMIEIFRDTLSGARVASSEFDMD